MPKSNGVIDAIIQTVLLAVDKKIERASFDRTVKGRISEVISSNKYKVIVNGTEYVAKSVYSHSINDVVYVLVPLNNYNDLIIIS